MFVIFKDIITSVRSMLPLASDFVDRKPFMKFYIDCDWLKIC